MFDKDHDFIDREVLKPYLGQTLTWYGVLYRNKAARIQHEHHKRQALIVSLYNPRYDIELHHIVLTINPRQCRDLDLYQPVKFEGEVYRYFQIKKYHSIPYQKETYGVKTSHVLRAINALPYTQLSKWVLERSKRYHLNVESYKAIPNNGQREFKISSEIFQSYLKPSNKSNHSKRS